MRQSRAEKQLQEENCSAAGSRERTEVYVVPKADFPIWFAQENYFPDALANASDTPVIPPMVTPFSAWSF